MSKARLLVAGPMALVVCSDGFGRRTMANGPAQGLELKSAEHRITEDTTYKDTTIIARCKVIVQKGCTLTLDNVRMLVEQNVSDEEARTGRIKDFKKRRGITINGSLVAQGWRLDEITGKEDVPHEVAFSVNGKVQMEGCVLGSRINFYPRGNSRNTLTDCTLGGIVQPLQSSQNRFKNCRLCSEMTNRYVELRHKTRNTFEDCELRRFLIVFDTSRNVFTRCVFPGKRNEFYGESVNSFDECTFTGYVAFFGHSQNQLKRCRFTAQRGDRWGTPGVVLSGAARLRFIPPASQLVKPGIYMKPGTMTPGKSIPCNPEIRGYLSLDVDRFDKGNHLTRFFPLVVVNPGNRKPVVGSKVQVVDKQGKVVSEGVTDKDGSAELGVTFDSTNYQKGNFWLAVNGNKRRSISLAVSSAEPICVELP